MNSESSLCLPIPIRIRTTQPYLQQAPRAWISSLNSLTNSKSFTRSKSLTNPRISLTNSKSLKTSKTLTLSKTRSTITSLPTNQQTTTTLNSIATTLIYTDSSPQSPLPVLRPASRLKLRSDIIRPLPIGNLRPSILPALLRMKSPPVLSLQSSVCSLRPDLYSAQAVSPYRYRGPLLHGHTRQ